jgi:hypothetical protein
MDLGRGAAQNGRPLEEESTINLVREGVNVICDVARADKRLFGLSHRSKYFSTC